MNTTKYQQLLEIMQDIGQISRSAGIKTYAVGGIVRDFILGHFCDDLDLTSDDIETLAILLIQKGGKIVERESDRFLGKIVAYQGIKIDLVSPRKESYNPQSIKPIVKMGTFEDDVLRRDFTINALYFDLDPSNFLGIVDLTGKGKIDLENKIINTPLDPKQTFIDDPSRMLRAVRFAAVKDFKIADRVVDVIKEMGMELLRVPFEVIKKELIKGAVSPKYFRIMNDVGLMDVLFPEVTAGRNIFQIPEYHICDVFEHILRTTEQIETDDPLLRIASLLHDVGKIPSDNGTGHFYEHIPMGIPIVKNILQKYKFSNMEIKYIKTIIRNHHTFHNLSNIYHDKQFNRDRSLRKFITTHDQNIINDLYLHSRADILSDRPNQKEALIILEEIMDTVKTISFENILNQSNVKLSITGHDIMELGYKGKEVGKIKNEIQDLVNEGVIPNFRETLLTKLQEYKK